MNTALHLLFLVLIGFMIGTLWSVTCGLIKAIRSYRRTRILHAQVEAEMDFLKERFDELFAEGRRCIVQHDWEGYRRVLKSIKVLDARWNREVTEKLKTKP